MKEKNHVVPDEVLSKEFLSCLLYTSKQVSRRAYFLADGKVYSSRAFSDLIRKESVSYTHLLFIRSVTLTLLVLLCRLVTLLHRLHMDADQLSLIHISPR